MSWRNTFIRRVRQHTVTALKLANFAFAIHFFAEYATAIEYPSGPSMLPTISAEGELVLVNKLVCQLFPERLGRGDIVTFVSPLDPQRVVCKRILGLPGDTICVDPTGEMAPSTEHIVVPTGHFWVGGDNAAWSRDSREYGPVPMALMKGRLVAKPDLALAKLCGIPKSVHIHFLNPVIRRDYEFNFLSTSGTSGDQLMVDSGRNWNHSTN